MKEIKIQSEKVFYHVSATGKTVTKVRGQLAAMRLFELFGGRITSSYPDAITTAEKNDMRWIPTMSTLQREYKQVSLAERQCPYCKVPHSGSILQYADINNLMNNLLIEKDTFCLKCRDERPEVVAIEYAHFDRNRARGFAYNEAKGRPNDY